MVAISLSLCTRTVDTYNQALKQLELITRDCGWFVYCYEEEEWHLYNDEDELLFARKTIEELAEAKQLGFTHKHDDTCVDTRKYGKRAYVAPTKNDNPALDDREERTKTIHGTDEEKGASSS